MATHDLSREQLFEILEHIYNEVYVLDHAMNVIYVNSSCSRNYGLLPEEMIGEKHSKFTGNIWFPSVIPEVYKNKRRMCVEQVIYTGKKVISTANPVFNDENQIELVVCVTEEKFEHIDIQYNADTNTICDTKNNERERSDDDFGEIIAVSDAMKALYKASMRSAQQDLPVLLQGESGTGKSMLAKFIHESGARRTNRFIAVNCATIPSNLLESELFGYKPHAFTGANPKGKAGLIRLADKGTLFLDEIAELALPLQAKLLDVLENKVFIPIGGSEVEHSDVRIISATNKDLQEMVTAKLFREDLYWRINVIGIRMPALRQRKDDIETLSHYFLQILNIKYHSHKLFSKEFIDLVSHYHWPGNIRQLKNAIERAVVIAAEDTIQIDDLPQSILKEMSAVGQEACTFKTFRESCVRKILEKSNEKDMHSRKLAEFLNISHTTASRLLRKYHSKEK